nr:MAG TPA: hypothetical protein [Caudoviricetes sp.]
MARCRRTGWAAQQTSGNTVRDCGNPICCGSARRASATALLRIHTDRASASRAARRNISRAPAVVLSF